MGSSHHLVRLALFACLTLLLIGAYLPALSAYLTFDDYGNLTQLDRILTPLTPASFWEAIWSSDSGPTRRPLAMFTFALQIGVFDAGVVPLKALNLIIHFAVGVALWRLAHMLVSSVTPLESSARRWLPITTAGLWLLHPFNLTSVAYTVQRMNSLSALFVVLALIAYTRMRLDEPNAMRYLNGLAAVLGWGLAGLLSKENAALLPLFVVVLEATILSKAAPSWYSIVRLPAPRVLATAVVLAAAGLVIWRVDQSAGGFSSRPFTLAERLLTEARVVCWYLRMTLLPSIGDMGLYHDDWRISTTLVRPVSTLFSIGFLVLLTGLGYVLRRRAPVVAFGVLFFLAGHLLESTFLSLDLVYEHRNYLPSFGIALAITASVGSLLARVQNGRHKPIGAVTLACIAAFTLAALTHDRAQRWSDEPAHRLPHLASQTKSVRAQIEAAETYAAMAGRATDGTADGITLEKADKHFRQAAAVAPGSPVPYFGWIMFRSEFPRAGDATGLLAPLRQRLRTGATPSSSVSGMDALANCAQQGPCGSIRGAVAKLFDNALRNPDAGPSDRASFMLQRAHFIAGQQRDYARAARLAGRATALVPERLDALIDHAYFLGLSGNQDRALERLSEAEQHDWLGRRVFTIRRLRLAVISDSLRATPSPGNMPSSE